MYNPKPIDVSNIELDEELLELSEKLAENVHDVWAVGRISQGWVYGEMRDDEKLTTPCLVAYDELPESEKEYDRNTALSSIKAIVALGYKIVKE